MRALITRGHLALYAPSAEEIEDRVGPLPAHLRHPVERLVRGVHLYAPEEAEWLLRARLFTEAPLNASAWGLVKTVAKRSSEVSSWNYDEKISKIMGEGLTPAPCKLPPLAHFQDLSASPPFSTLEEASSWLLARAEEENARLLVRGEGQESPLEGEEGGRRWRGARRVVAAALLTPELQPLALAFKQPEVHPTYHAEWALLDALLRGRLAVNPSLTPSLTLLSTLKPCKLCAGAWASYGPPHLKVHDLADDPGRLGQNTAFDEGSYAWEQAQRERSQQVRLSRQP